MRVLLLAGGESSEREVSLNSGRAVFEALRRIGHEVRALDPATGLSLVGSDGQYLAAPGQDTGTAVVDRRSIAPTLSAANTRDTDVVLIALHGGAGENGTIQNLLDLAGIKYTGSGMRASAIAMDKAITKRIAESAGITTPAWRLYRIGRDGLGIDEAVSDAGEHFRPPVIVKPNDGGSTIGLTRVTDPGQFRGAFETALSESRQVLVEEYVPGREITAAVLCGQALPLVEIVPKSGLYDYRAKYTKGMSQYIAPAELPTETASRIQGVARQVYDMVGASGLCRLDFILRDDGRFFFLEINTVPGMTSLSLAPMAAQAAGISFEQLIERLLSAALAG